MKVRIVKIGIRMILIFSGRHSMGRSCRNEVEYGTGKGGNLRFKNQILQKDKFSGQFSESFDVSGVPDRVTHDRQAGGGDGHAVRKHF